MFRALFGFGSKDRSPQRRAAASRVGRRRRCQLRVEELEPSVVPVTATLDPIGHALFVRTEFTDTWVRLSNEYYLGAANQIVEGSGGFSDSFPGAGFNRIVVTNASNNNNTITIWGALKPVEVKVLESKTHGDTVLVGNGRLTDILGAVTISNQNSRSAIEVDDHSDSTHRSSGYAGDSWVNGLGGALVNYNPAQISSLTVRTGPAGVDMEAATWDFPTTLIATGTANSLAGLYGATTCSLLTLSSGIVTGSGIAGSATFSGYQTYWGSFLDTLVGPGTQEPTTRTVWAITGADSGTITSTGYAGSFAFRDVPNLVAFNGPGANSFVFSDGARISFSITGSLAAGAVNTLDYQAYTTSVVVDLNPAVLSATGVADGSANGIANIQNVIGGNSAGPYNLLIGGGGNLLIGGTSRRNILVAGSTASTLNGGNQDDLLIGGTTTYDDDATLTSWNLIADYWATGGILNDDINTRASKLLSGDGVPMLNATNVMSNGGGNAMNGTGEKAWLFYRDTFDFPIGFDLADSPPPVLI